jgi:predicted ATPase
VGDQDVADRLAAAVGLSHATFPLHEIYWAARKFLESRTADGPLIALVDDIHWAESAFLDLLVNVLDTSEAPILLLCTSRHDLLEKLPDWGEQASAIRLVLRPLTDEAAAKVALNLLGATGLPADVVARIVEAPRATRSTSSRCCRCSSTAAPCARRTAAGSAPRATARSRSRRRSRR